MHSNTGNDTASSTYLDYLVSAAVALKLLCTVYANANHMLLLYISITDSVIYVAIYLYHTLVSLLTRILIDHRYYIVYTLHIHYSGISLL
jgi:hypothetical protein